MQTYRDAHEFAQSLELPSHAHDVVFHALHARLQTLTAEERVSFRQMFSLPLGSTAASTQSEISLEHSVKAPTIAAKLTPLPEAEPGPLPRLGRGQKNWFIKLYGEEHIGRITNLSAKDFQLLVDNLCFLYECLPIKGIKDKQVRAAQLNAFMEGKLCKEIAVQHKTTAKAIMFAIPKMADTFRKYIDEETLLVLVPPAQSTPMSVDAVEPIPQPQHQEQTKLPDTPSDSSKVKWTAVFKDGQWQTVQIS